MRLTYAKRGRSKNGLPGGQVARGASIPAPVEGWDAVSPIANMKPTRAVRLINWFPQPDWIELRKGHVLHADTLTGDPVETVMAYAGVASNKLFAVSGDTIFDVTAGDPAVADVTGLANARFQYTNFATTGGNFLCCVNGADGMRYYDGSAWATATITGDDIDATDFIHITPHKSRLWFTINESSDAAYLPVDSIQGTAVRFPVGGNWWMGGYLMAICSWSLDAGDGPDDYIAFISSKGQVSVYKGIDPGDDFTLVGTYYTGSPLGRRCYAKVGADIALVCVDGVVPLSKALVYERAAVQKVSLTERIQRVMNQSARDYGENFGWQLMSYPRGTRAILNVPVAEGEDQQQYVMNTLHGAWCQFIGMNANCWELFEERPFFGGNDGRVYEADRSGTDYLATLRADMIGAFSAYGKPGNQKRWNMCRTLLTTDGQVEPGLAFNVDFRYDAPISVPATPARQEALWDEGLWDVSSWSGAAEPKINWTSVTGIGYWASIRLVVDVESPGVTGGSIWGIGLWGVADWSATNGAEITLQVNGFNMVCEDGSFV